MENALHQHLLSLSMQAVISLIGTNKFASNAPLDGPSMPLIIVLLKSCNAKLKTTMEAVLVANKDIL
jgi:hypothetical protein